MEESYKEDAFNVASENSKATKTSSGDGSSSKTTKESEVQDGAGVEKHEEKPYEQADDQQEYIEQANDNTEVANENPVQNGKGMTMVLSAVDDDDDDEDDDDDDDDDPLTETEIGDDPGETKKKIPVF